MGLRPDEAGIDEANFIEALELFEAQCEQLSTFGLSDGPSVWRAEESIARPTE